MRRLLLTAIGSVALCGCAELTGVSSYLLNPGVPPSPRLWGSLHITSSPSPAKIYQSGRPGQWRYVGQTPFEIPKAQLPTSGGFVNLKAEVPGYQPKELFLALNEFNAIQFDLISAEAAKIPLEKYLDSHSDTPLELQQLMKEHKIRTGMTEALVELSWGIPDWKLQNGSLWGYEGHVLSFREGKLAEFTPHLQAHILYGEYEGNEVAADEEYQGKIIAVSGLVTKIGKDIYGTPYLTLEGGKYESVQCFFPAIAEKEKLAKLPPPAYGSITVTVRGSVRGKTLWFVVLDDCELLRSVY